MVFMIGVSTPTMAVCVLGRLRTRPCVRLRASIIPIQHQASRRFLVSC